LSGRRSRDRTCDLSLVRAALSQLSYPPVAGILASLRVVVNPGNRRRAHAPAGHFLESEPRSDAIRSDARDVAVLGRLGLDVETTARA
jgi:hypothetical protein